MSLRLPYINVLSEEYPARTAKVTDVNMVTDVTGVWGTTDNFSEGGMSPGDMLFEGGKRKHAANVAEYSLFIFPLAHPS